jgi:hypothetical protein
MGRAVVSSSGGMTPCGMGPNPRLILGRSPLLAKLGRGLWGTTRKTAMWSRGGLGTTPDLLIPAPPTCLIALTA